MNDLSSEKTMTTKEVAEALGVSIVTVRNNGKELFPNKVIENGKPIHWTETEAKLILEKIRENQAGSKATCKPALQVIRSDMTSKIALARQADEIVNNLDNIQTADFLAFTRAITDAYIAETSLTPWD